MLKPIVCRPEAYEYFAAQLPTIESTDSLVRAAVAVSMHAFDDLNPDDVEDRLMALSTRISGRYQIRDLDTVLAHLHHTLFEEEGYGGDRQAYEHPLGSYFAAVLETKRGLPIVISLIYKAVGEHLGLRIEGVNAPCHFLVQVATPNKWQLVDPYHRGSFLTREEAFDHIEKFLGSPIERNTANLQPASHAQWLQRLLANLQHVLAHQRRLDDLAAMNELQELLQEELF